jgi:ubiquitin-protein ligase
MTTRKKTNSATERLRQDYIRLKKDPVPYVVAEPLASNILEWYASNVATHAKVKKNAFFTSKALRCDWTRKHPLHRW